MTARKNNQSVKNQSAATANALKFTTYTSQKSGKTIPVVYGFTDKDDERILYIAQIGKDGEPSAVRGRYTCLPIGKGDERIPCVMWGAHESWHDVAKLAAKTVSDLDAMTQKAYEALCAKANEVYQQRKAESKAEKETEKKAAKPQPKKASPQPSPVGDAAQKPTPKKEVKTEGKKSTPKSQSTMMFSYAEVEDILNNAFNALAKAMKTDANFKPLIDATMDAAKAVKVA